MRFGLFVPAFAELADPRRVADLAHTAEEAGWEGWSAAGPSSIEAISWPWTLRPSARDRYRTRCPSGPRASGRTGDRWFGRLGFRDAFRSSRRPCPRRRPLRPRLPRFAASWT